MATITTPSYPVESGVKAFQGYQKGQIFIGETVINNTGVASKFTYGTYVFSNIHSANMFAYLSKKYDNKIAQSAVELFEKKLAQSSAVPFLQFVQLDLEELLTKGKLKPDVIGILTDVAIAIGGSIITGVRIRNELGQYNPNSAKHDQEQYVLYAIAYWRHNPTHGPAYQSLSDIY